jgi:hypothetical protein
MDTGAILNRLAEAGISLGIDASGQGLTVESPAPLSPEQRRWLRANKPAILSHLRQESAAVSPAPPPLSAADHAAIAEALAERAAIMEYDGELPRPDAEAAAAARMRAYHVHIAMPAGPPRWAVMLAPGCDLPEATAAARRLFGHERVLAVQPTPGTAGPAPC